MLEADSQRWFVAVAGGDGGSKPTCRDSICAMKSFSAAVVVDSADTDDCGCDAGTAGVRNTPPSLSLAGGLGLAVRRALALTTPFVMVPLWPRPLPGLLDSREMNEALDGGVLLLAIMLLTRGGDVTVPTEILCNKV